METMFNKNSKSYFFLIPTAIVIAGIFIAAGVFINNISQPKSVNPDNEENVLPLTGSFAPSFSLKATDGNEISLNDLKGQNLLLVFWSPTCPYSIKEQVDLKKFADAYRGKITVVAILYKNSSASAAQYKQNENINFTMLLDSDGKVAEKYKIQGTPSHFFINKQGKITAVVPDYTPFDVLMIHAREMFSSE
jgi:peroxiredoxin